VGRRLGQHFLIRSSVLQRIAEAVCPNHVPLVIEIGPGKGALTEYLVERSDRVVAIEADEELAGYLSRKFAGHEGLHLVHADVLETDLAQWGRAVVAGNLPYYITSPILKQALALGPLLERAVFLVQKEVAERITAHPGTRQYGYLTVATQIYAHAELLFTAGPSSFHPPPQVDSAAIRLTPHGIAEQLGIVDAERFLEFAGTCFRHKRKTIRNNLAEAFDKAALENLPHSAQRAEQLSLAELAELYSKIVDRGS